MKQLFIITMMAMVSSTLFAQAGFMTPFDGFSKKKTVYITLENGKEITGQIRDLDRKKGLIEGIKIKDSKGKKRDLDLKEIKFAYLPQRAWDQYAKAVDKLTDSQQWDETPYDSQRLKDGYAYFEKGQAIVNKKERTLLLQLLNPGICENVKVYHDPFSKETMSLGVKGVTLVGGLDKSYYVSKKGKAAFRMMKKKYDEQFNETFGDCDNVLKEFGEEKKWNKLADVMKMYNEECK